MNTEPKIPKGPMKWLRYLLTGIVIVEWKPLHLSRGTKWIPICDRNRNHPYHKWTIYKMQKSKERSELWLRSILKIDRKILHQPMEI